MIAALLLFAVQAACLLYTSCSATSSGKISTLAIASGGRLRTAPKLPIRRPLTRITGRPLPRPRPDRVIGSSAVNNSSIDEAP